MYVVIWWFPFIFSTCSYYDIYSQVTYNFAPFGVPIPDARHGECSVMQGLTAALEALTECSEAQLEKLKTMNDTKTKALLIE